MDWIISNFIVAFWYGTCLNFQFPVNSIPHTQISLKVSKWNNVYGSNYHQVIQSCQSCMYIYQNSFIRGSLTQNTTLFFLLADFACWHSDNDIELLTSMHQSAMTRPTVMQKHAWLYT